MALSHASNETLAGLVAIGRNEGERLHHCLKSAPRCVGPVVYVDSGSTDGSVSMARRVGAQVLELEPSIPFTAARARNEGIARLLSIAPQTRFVQVIDGDCELIEGWIEAAVESIEGSPDVAVVCGRRRERYPDASVYNRLCDLEWNTPVGEIDSCGGDALIRIDAWRAVGGYDPSLIAGEEPEMCLRMRSWGWRILRLDRDMTLHDARMTHFSQWFMRNVRAGHAYAEGYDRHGRTAEDFCRRPLVSNLAWGLALPIVAVGGLPISFGASIGILAGGYTWLWRRVYGDALEYGLSASEASLYARWCVLGKLPQGLGAAQYFRNRLRGRPGRIIEYKQPDEQSD